LVFCIFFVVWGLLIGLEKIPYNESFVGGATVIALGLVLVSEHRMEMEKLKQSRKKFMKQLHLLKQKRRSDLR